VVFEIDFEKIKADQQKDTISLSDLQKLFPLSATYSFDNDNLSFKNRLIDAKPIKDEKMLVDYVEYLRNLMQKKDIAGLFEEYKYKLQDYDLAFPQDAESDNKAWFIELMENRFFPSGPVDDFKREEIGCISWCEGRIWELFLKPDRALWSTRGINGKRIKIEVYAGLVEDKIKIIR